MMVQPELCSVCGAYDVSSTTRDCVCFDCDFSCAAVSQKDLAVDVAKLVLFTGASESSGFIVVSPPGSTGTDGFLFPCTSCESWTSNGGFSRAMGPLTLLYLAVRLQKIWPCCFVEFWEQIPMLLSRSED